ncbi:MAG: polysaccharide lyase, partial [Lachnospira sp.]
MQKIRRVFAKVVAGLMVVSSLAMAAPSMAYASSSSDFTTVGGWNEMMYATIKGVKDADVTAVSYSGPVSGSLTGDDFEYLVRDTQGGVRVDVMGLKPGTYTLNVTTKSGTYTQSGIEVNAQDRSGFAHYNYTEGVGAYNDDGTLKDNAIVLYVTDDNKNTVSLTYDGVTVTGIGNILNSVGKACGESGHETDCKKISDGKTYYGKGNTNQGILQKLAENNIPLVIRMIGVVSESGLYEPGTWAASDAGLIDGLTEFDSNDYGGSEGDNGHMARMKSAKDVTIEGVGTDAAMDGWGVHFMSETSTTEAGLGKSFEVRNLTFMNQPEDAIGMEGVQSGSVITAPVERCWIHNNEFYSPSISGPAESDKSEGDGSCDFKRGEYLTVSYNYFEGCHKTNLVGSSDTSLQYNLTYHHNIWKGCKARQPLGRQANMHFYNNQFIGTTDYAMNTRANAYIFSEYNLFFMTKNPMDIDSGAIKSYNDSFSSCIGAMGGTVVTDKSTTVSSGNKYENFDTNASLSYIPSGNYQLQTSVTEAAKVLKAYNGCMPENAKTPENVSTSECSLLSYCAPSVTPINVAEYPYKATPGKLSKTVYAFTVGGLVDVTIEFSAETLTATGCLVNEAGECFQVGSGTVTGLPAGTYMIMPYNIQAGGNGVNPAAGTFKEMTINSLTINAADPNAHYHHYVSEVTKKATCTEEGVITYTCTSTNGTCDKKTYTEAIPKTAHTYGDWVVEKEATETEEG